MRVIHLPAHINNPYHEFLAQGLTRFGVNVICLDDNVDALRPVSGIVKKYRPEVVHLHWHYSFVFSEVSAIRSVVKLLLFILDLSTTKKHCKLVWTVHNKYDHERKYPHLDLLSAKMLCLLADAVEVKGQKARDFVQKRYNIRSNKIYTIPHGNYLPIYRKLDQNECKSKLGINPGSKVFLHLGQIRPYKGARELIKSFKELDLPNTVLIIAGKVVVPDFADELRLLANNSPSIYLFLEYVGVGDLPIFFGASAIFAAPFQDVLTSGSVILSMSFAKPVIAPRIGCISEYLRESCNFLYYPNNIINLKKTLRKAYEMNDKVLDDMGNDNYITAKENFDWNRISKMTSEMYYKILM